MIYHARPANPAGGPSLARLDKPLDAGNGLVSASVARGGAWLSLGSAHSKLGYIELSGLPRFDESWRGNAQAVRRYRFLMTEERWPFLELAPLEREPIETEGYDLIDGVHPYCAMAFDGYAHEITTRAADRLPAIRQRHVLRATGRAPAELRLVLRFRGWIGRPALGEITETAALADTYALPTLEAAGETLVVGAASLPASAEIRVEARGLGPASWEIDSGGARLTARWDRSIDPEASVDITCTLREGGPVRPGSRDRDAGANPPSPTGFVGSRAQAAPLVMPDSVRAGFEWLAFRALSYTMRCTALVTAPEEICLLTDHRLLPLSWTRDAYYQALLLLTAGSRGSVGAVAAHLRWLWARCDRVDGSWMRSHLPNGDVKDARFQLDQQLYPMLELCDYFRTTGALPTLTRSSATGKLSEWGALIAQAWGAVPCGSELGFATTEENPADDPAGLPHVLSSEILRWYTATRLAELQQDLPLSDDFTAVAEQLRRSIYRHFTCEGPYGPQWAYAIDGAGNNMLYNDANDLPTAFAPLWGFCDAGDPAWQSTMRFTFSAHNPGLSPGRFGGLGSLHTPGTWPLGDIQEWVSWSLMSDTARAQRPLTRLLAATTADGMLPETYDSTTGMLGARHWFAWPGALVGTLYLMAIGTCSPWVAPDRRERALPRPGRSRPRIEGL